MNNLLSSRPKSMKLKRGYNSSVPDIQNSTQNNFYQTHNEQEQTSRIGTSYRLPKKLVNTKIEMSQLQILNFSLKQRSDYIRHKKSETTQRDNSPIRKAKGAFFDICTPFMRTSAEFAQTNRSKVSTVEAFHGFQGSQIQTRPQTSYNLYKLLKETNKKEEYSERSKIFLTSFKDNLGLISRKQIRERYFNDDDKKNSTTEGPPTIFGMMYEVKFSNKNQKIMKVIEQKRNTFTLVTMNLIENEENYEGKISIDCNNFEKNTKSKLDLEYYISTNNSDPDKGNCDLSFKSMSYKIPFMSIADKTNYIYMKIQSNEDCKFQLFFSTDEINTKKKNISTFRIASQTNMTKQKKYTNNDLLKDQDNLDMVKYIKSNIENSKKTLQSTIRLKNKVDENVKKVLHFSYTERNKRLNDYVEMHKKRVEKAQKCKKEETIKKILKATQFLGRQEVMRTTRIKNENEECDRLVIFYQRLHWIYLLYFIQSIKNIRTFFTEYQFKQIVQKNLHRQLVKCQKELQDSVSNFVVKKYGIRDPDQSIRNRLMIHDSIHLLVTHKKPKILKISKKTLGEYIFRQVILFLFIYKKGI